MIPTYEIVFNPEDAEAGIQLISFVKNPAIEVDWITLAADTTKVVLDSEKQLVVGPVLIPGQKIYRNDPEKGEYYITFSKETIESLANKFLDEGRTRGFNLEHEDVMVPANIRETWIKTSDNDKSADYGFKLPVGTWFLSAHVKDKEVWKSLVKSGLVKGFSMEGMLSMEIKNNIQKMETEVKLNTWNLVDGGVIETPGDFEVGAAVTINGEVAPDGTYNVTEGYVIVVVGGVIASMEEVMPEVPMATLSMADITTLIEGLRAEITELSKRFDEAIAAKDAVIAEAETKLAKLSGTPGAEFITLADDEVEVPKKRIDMEANKINTIAANIRKIRGKK